VKLPRLFNLAGRHRSTDPLGDPFADADDPSFPDVGPDQNDFDQGGSDPSATGAPAVAAGSDPSTVVFDDTDATAPPEVVDEEPAVHTERPENDVELDLDFDFDPSPADETRRSARGMLSKLFGDPDSDSMQGLRGLRDLDGSPLRGKGRIGAAGAGAAVVLVLLGVWLLWPSSPPPEGDDATATASSDDGQPGDIPSFEVNEPDRVVMALPPLSEGGADSDGSGGFDGALVEDPTAQTDRSSARRPWLDDGGGDATGGEDAANPWREMEQQGAEGAAQPDPQGETDSETATAPVAEPEPEPEPETEPETATASTDIDQTGQPSANPWQDTETRGAAGEGVRARVDLAAPEIDLPDLPGLLTVPADVHRVVEPEGPNRLSETPPIPSYSDLSEAKGTRGAPLPDAPFSKLVGRGPYGTLPKIADDGTRPWQAYAAPDPATSPEQPRVAIVVRGLGMMNDDLEAAITKLPPPVTLSFSPYAVGLWEKQGLARSAGHEVMLDLPMESEAFPADDPGPLGLMTLLPQPETRDRLEQILSKGQGYVGALATVSGPFTDTPDTIEPVLETLSEAGLLYLHQGVHQSLIANRRVTPALTMIDAVIDERGFAESIDARLDYLTRLAKARGVAVGVMSATPLGFAKLKAWSDGLAERGVALVPVSAAVQRARALSGTGGAGAEASSAAAGVPDRS